MCVCVCVCVGWKILHCAAAGENSRANKASFICIRSFAYRSDCLGGRGRSPSIPIRAHPGMNEKSATKRKHFSLSLSLSWNRNRSGLNWIPWQRKNERKSREKCMGGVGCEGAHLHGLISISCAMLPLRCEANRQRGTLIHILIITMLMSASFYAKHRRVGRTKSRSTFRASFPGVMTS